IILILAILPKHKELLLELKVSRNILGAAILTQFFTIALWMSSLYFGPGESHQAMLRLITEFALLFWGGVIFLGLGLPLLLGVWALLRERQTKEFSYTIPILTSVMVLIGGFILRYVVIIAAQ
ncbi:MAG: polysulfide reductase NrfD, partial [Omnitrophica bacterium]|nr:polysulfide reductase NrfD [Candidatus Omnitrophota bacterium]